MQTPATRPLEERPVADVMTRDLLTLGPDESVLMAWELMCQNRSHHLPVVDEEGHCLGVIDAQTITTTWEASSPQRARRPVRLLLAHRRFVPVSPTDSVGTAAGVMLQQGVDHVAIVDGNGLLVGLLTARDLVSALAGRVRDDGRAHPSMPSLYRIEPVLPGHAASTGTTGIDPPGGEDPVMAESHRQHSLMSPD